ncbi:MAG: hypothetical protein HOK81_11020, partial [Rhodospirillaceae bacterium]|nr:hypothetical protein [Rhodospirillaceae bacterium]
MALGAFFEKIGFGKADRQGRADERLRGAFAREEQRGLDLALRLRLGAAAVVSLWALTQFPLL